MVMFVFAGLIILSSVLSVIMILRPRVSAIRPSDCHASLVTRLVTTRDVNIKVVTSPDRPLAAHTP